LGRDAEAGRFLGCCEHAFVQKGVPHAEINLVFVMHIAGLTPGVPVKAAEEWIGFRWQPLEKLDEAEMEPEPLRKLIVAWLQQPGGHCVSGDAWL